MPIVRTTSEKTCFLSFEGEIKIYDAATYKEQIFKDFESFEHMKLDLSKVEEIDASGLQLLILLKKESILQSLELDFTALSTPVTRVLDLYRLTDWLIQQN